MIIVTIAIAIIIAKYLYGSLCQAGSLIQLLYTY